MNDNFIIDLCSCCQTRGYFSRGTVNFSTISILKTWSIVQETQQCSFKQTEMDIELYLMDGLITSLLLLSGLQLRVCNKNLIFLFLNQNICCGYSKEPSQ